MSNFAGAGLIGYRLYKAGFFTPLKVEVSPGSTLGVLCSGGLAMPCQLLALPCNLATHHTS